MKGLRLYNKIAKVRGKPVINMLGKHGKNNPNSKPVIQYDLNGIEIVRFDNAIEAGKYLNADSSQIAACCRNNNKTTKGYKWAYAAKAILNNIK